MKHSVKELCAMAPQDAIAILVADILSAVRPLLGSNTKVEKAKGLGIRTAGVTLAPATESVPFGGRNMCPKASFGCALSCLKYAGHNVMPYNSLLRIAKTLVFLHHREAFVALLYGELERHIRNSMRAGQVPAFRSQVLHDHPAFGAQVARDFPDLQVYDYTAIVSYAVKHKLEGTMPDNFHLTVSRKEFRHPDTLRALQAGLNVSVVFDGPFPTTFAGHPVIDGDEHDARFLDPKGVVVGLKLKGTKAAKQAARDSGFAIMTDGSGADPVPLHAWALQARRQALLERAA